MGIKGDQSALTTCFGAMDRNLWPAGLEPVDDDENRWVEILERMLVDDRLRNRVSISSNQSSDNRDLTSFTSQQTEIREPDLQYRVNRQENTGYNLRPGFHNDNPTYGEPVFDNDDSGDFDPTAEEAAKPQTVQKQKKLDEARDATLQIPIVRQPEIKTAQTGRRQGRDSFITLKIGHKAWASEQGIALAHALKEARDNWPIAYKLRERDQPNFTELSVDSIQNERLRKRPAANDSTDDSANDNARKILRKDVTLGYPEARGCEACLELGSVCSLVEGGKYPCKLCKSEGEECHLILEPKLKRGCVNCSHRRIVCPFRNQPDLSSPCKPCAQKGFKCVAGPLDGYTRVGPSLDRPYGKPKKFYEDASVQLLVSEHMETRRRHAGSKEPPKEYDVEYVHARKKSAAVKRTRIEVEEPIRADESNEGQTSKNSRPLTEFELHHGKKSNKRKFVPQTFEPMTKPQKQAKLSSLGLQHGKHSRKGRLTSQLSQQSLSQTEMTEALSKGCGTGEKSKKKQKAWSTRFIKTRFPHPVQFFFNGPEDGIPACHWCADLGYGLFGFPERVVEVIDTGEDGYIEVKGGHVGEGSPPSRMCSDCAMSRLRILACKGHNLTVLRPSRVPKEFKIWEWCGVGIAAKAPFSWCSVCTMPAEYVCQYKKVQGEISTVEGCGLMLCGSCAAPFYCNCDRNLSKLIAAREDMKGEDVRARADASFLSGNGHLMARFG